MREPRKETGKVLLPGPAGVAPCRRSSASSSVPLTFLDLSLGWDLLRCLDLPSATAAGSQPKAQPLPVFTPVGPEEGSEFPLIRRSGSSRIPPSCREQKREFVSERHPAEGGGGGARQEVENMLINWDYRPHYTQISAITDFKTLGIPIEADRGPGAEPGASLECFNKNRQAVPTKNKQICK